MQHDQNTNTTSDSTKKGYGPQGVDKAPGEEAVSNNAPFLQESQKGKKNDGDPDLASDKPTPQSDI